MDLLLLAAGAADVDPSLGCHESFDDSPAPPVSSTRLTVGPLFSSLARPVDRKIAFSPIARPASLPDTTTPVASKHLTNPLGIDALLSAAGMGEEARGDCRARRVPLTERISDNDDAPPPARCVKPPAPGPAAVALSAARAGHDAEPAGRAAARFACRAPVDGGLCGKRYATCDGVRKHCRQQHRTWLRTLPLGRPELYCWMVGGKEETQTGGSQGAASGPEAAGARELEPRLLLLSQPIEPCASVSSGSSDATEPLTDGSLAGSETPPEEVLEEDGEEVEEERYAAHPSKRRRGGLATSGAEALVATAELCASREQLESAGRGALR